MESTRRGVASALFSVELHNQGVNSEDGKVLCARRADVIHTLEQVREMQVALFVACGCNWIKQREKDDPFCLSAPLLKTTTTYQFDEALHEHIRVRQQITISSVLFCLFSPPSSQ